MTPEQHADILGEQVKHETVTKYMAGAKEHGGNLWEVPIPALVDSAIEESIDEGVYLRTVRQQMVELKELVVKLTDALEDTEEQDDEVMSLIDDINKLLYG